MKISRTVMSLAGIVSANLDGNTIHRNGCVWPDSGVLSSINKITYADDPYANFQGLSATGLDNPYAEGTLIVRQCPTRCNVDEYGNYVDCTGYEDDSTFVCGYKDGKGSRGSGRHYVFLEMGTNKAKNIALFFRTGQLNKYRPAPARKMCPKPHVVANDALCGDKPKIPNKSDVERFNRYSVWNDEKTSISCTAESKPVRSKNFEPLNLVCDRKKSTDSFKWFHMSPNGKLRPVGNKWVKTRFLCKFCHSCKDEETSGDEPEGSGVDSPNDAEVSI